MTVLRLVPAEDAPAKGLDARSDDELMTLAQAGVREAFAVLVARHAVRLARLCARFANDAQQGNDLAQDVWVQAYQRRASYRPEGRFLSWLVTLACNHCRNHLRRRRPTAAALASSEPADPSAPQIERILGEERQRRVRAALAELTPAMREALLLRYAEELRYDEMSAVLGTGETTLRSRVHHGLRTLKQKLEGDV